MEGLKEMDSVPIRPRALDCPILLTALQMHFWNHLNQKGTLLSRRMCIVGTHAFEPLNLNFLRNSLEALIQRHESLRTRFVIVDGVPRQHVDEIGERSFCVIELPAVSPANADGEINRVAQEFYEEKVDLSVGPLFSAKLVRV